VNGDKLHPMERCDECGFDYDGLTGREAAGVFNAHAAAISELLQSNDDVHVRVRPRPSVWSAIEYTCHVRDVLLMQRERVFLVLVEDTPQFAPMYRDQRVENARYDQEEIPDLIRELGVAAELMVKLGEMLSDDQLARQCIYGFPEPTERDLDWVFRHTAHELIHHEMDIHRSVSKSIRAIP